MINSENFIQDFRDLYLKSPQCGSWSRGSENCDYGDIITVSKDSYMCFNSGNCRDAYYCEDSRALTNCTDCAFCEQCELCYECVDCNNCYDSNYCQDSVNCEDIHFSYDLRRCKHCIGCVGLRDKEYYIFNKKHSQEDYEKALETLDFSNPKILEEIDKKLEVLKREIPRKFVHQFDTQNCTGDYIYHSKNCYRCFDTRHTEDSGYIYQANLDMGTKDSWDCGPIPTGMDLCYDIAYSHYLFNCKHLYWCGNLKDSQYCTNCFESKNLFGCHYIKSKEDGYYILNQKVDEDFYKKTTKEIIDILREKGIYALYDLLFKDLDRDVVSVSDDQLGRSCTLCGDNFEITEDEIGFYKKMDIILPIYCPNCRAEQRIDLRNERKMYKRECGGCKNPLITTYSPDNPHIVYCLDCYWQNIG
ncbi:hypothetical protein KJ742_05015 [Patescibacteria group bacterium]|nr:hypothetical protein [Patescibacteria group bacterium]MBU1683279.1 hypothetical protein [Patescibacteria group bacterium]MBU1935710.1 hypothetical protein [Patescibacteria group bacterium]